MVGTLGEPGLPNNETRLLSQNHVLQPGFLAASLPVVTPTPTPPPTPTPTPSPTPPPACESPTISINDGALFTHSTAVTLNLCAPNAVEMKISNDGGFGGAVWEPYAETRAWTITSYGQYVLPRFVYVMYRMADGTIHGNYFDDIILDPNPPVGEMAVGENQLLELAAKNTANTLADAARGVQTRETAAYAARNSDGSVDLYIVASDDNSGLSEMQIAASPAFTDTVWEPYSALKQWLPAGGDGIKTVYGRFRDSAGNISEVANTSFALDTLPPLGGIAAGPRIVGPDTVTTTVYLGAEDNLSGVEDMRVSLDPVFANAAWQPYATTVTWPVSLTAQSVITLYAQYRDVAGNASEVYTDTLLVDTNPPLVYVEVEPGSTPTRNVTVLAYDGLAGQSAGVATMRLSNDPLWLDTVVTVPYTPTVSWTFDDSLVVWVQVKDMVGNWSEPYPAYAPPTCDLVGGDDLITVADLQAEASRWQQSAGLPYDRNGDNQVTIVDIMWYAARWGGSCE